MRRLLRTIWWDLLLQLRYQIITVAIVITAAYTLVFKLLARDGFDEVLVVLIFSDPAMIGFIFIGALVLFEKGSGTIDALIVTPLKKTEYLFSKVISLGIIAIICSLVMAIAGHGWRFNYFFFIYGVVFTSSIFTLIGFIGVSRVKSMNQFVIIIPFFMIPFILPLLNFFNLTSSWILYLIPTQAFLDLLWASFHAVPTGRIIFALIYLPIWLGLVYYFALRAFDRNIIISSHS
ncbi:MAG: ABC transporter permease [Bacteroidales bacterium]